MSVNHQVEVFVNAFCQVDRKKVLSRGKEVIGKLLIDLQVRKSTADGAGARQFYTQLTTPLPGWDKDIRDVVLKKKTVGDLVSQFLRSIEKPIISSVQPRKLFVQPNTLIQENEVVLKDYPLTPAGVIQSFIERRV